MSPVLLPDLFAIYDLPSGRAMFAARQIVAVATLVVEHLPILERAEAFAEAANVALGLEMRYRQSKSSPQYGPQAMELDGRLDGALGLIDRTIKNYSALVEDPTTEPEMVDAVHLLSTKLFPRGLTHITLMSFPEEYEAVARLRARLEGGDLAAAAARLSLQPFIDRLAAVHDAFGAELSKARKNEGPRWDEVRAARAVTQTRALELLAVVLGTYPDSDEVSISKRTTLLEPLMAQQRALAALYKKRRGAQDVNPETGELVPTASETSNAPEQ